MKIASLVLRGLIIVAIAQPFGARADYRQEEWFKQAHQKSKSFAFPTILAFLTGAMVTGLITDPLKDRIAFRASSEEHIVNSFEKMLREYRQLLQEAPLRSKIERSIADFEEGKITALMALRQIEDSFRREIHFFKYDVDQSHLSVDLRNGLRIYEQNLEAFDQAERAAGVRTMGDVDWVATLGGFAGEVSDTKQRLQNAENYLNTFLSTRFIPTWREKLSGEVFELREQIKDDYVARFRERIRKRQIVVERIHADKLERRQDLAVLTADLDNPNGSIEALKLSTLKAGELQRLRAERIGSIPNKIAYAGLIVGALMIIVPDAVVSDTAVASIEALSDLELKDVLDAAANVLAWQDQQDLNTQMLLDEAR